MTPQVAVIGCGYWGKNLVRNFAQLGALRMVGDAAEAGRKLAAEIAPYTQIVANVEEMLDAPVEGVVIATPAETHYELTRQAPEAGKDVLCCEWSWNNNPLWSLKFYPPSLKEGPLWNKKKR